TSSRRGDAGSPREPGSSSAREVTVHRPGERRSRRSPRLLPAALIAVAALVLCGCSLIPTSGDIVDGQPVAGGRDPAYVGLFAEPPRPGDNEVAIAQGFLEAMASYAPGYPVARKYLAPDVSADWQPGAGVAI